MAPRPEPAAATRDKRRSSSAGAQLSACDSHARTRRGSYHERELETRKRSFDRVGRSVRHLPWGGRACEGSRKGTPPRRVQKMAEALPLKPDGTVDYALLGSQAIARLPFFEDLGLGQNPAVCEALGRLESARRNELRLSSLYHQERATKNGYAEAIVFLKVRRAAGQRWASGRPPWPRTSPSSSSAHSCPLFLCFSRNKPSCSRA